MSGQELITLIIAAYAAVLSTINLYLQRRDKQGRLQVTLKTGLIGFSQGTLSDPVLILAARNRADRSVIVTILGFILPTGENMLYLTPQSDVSFPFELKPERDCRAWFDLKTISRQLHDAGFGGTVKLVGFFDDAVGRKHKSKTIKLNTESWK